jgi:threonine/homoserine/homoserine lactone efflux protein
MFGIHDFWVFLTAGILLNLTPGPDTFYILGRSVAQGRSAGVASVLGISVGSIFHTLAAAVGLSALLAASSIAFTIIKLAGGAYLVYLGVRMLLAGRSSTALSTEFASPSFASAFRQGIVTNILNPKVALFFLAFMPQFIAPESESKFLAFVTLGLCFVTTGTIWCLCLAWFSAMFSKRLRGDNAVAQVLNKATGGLFILLGVRVATAK